MFVTGSKYLFVFCAAHYLAKLFAHFYIFRNRKRCALWLYM